MHPLALGQLTPEQRYALFVLADDPGTSLRPRLTPTTDPPSVWLLISTHPVRRTYRLGGLDVQALLDAGYIAPDPEADALPTITQLGMESVLGWRYAQQVER